MAGDVGCAVRGAGAFVKCPRRDRGRGDRHFLDRQWIENDRQGRLRTRLQHDARHPRLAKALCSKADLERPTDTQPTLKKRAILRGQRLRRCAGEPMNDQHPRVRHALATHVAHDAAQAGRRGRVRRGNGKKEPNHKDQAHHRPQIGLLHKHRHRLRLQTFACREVKWYPSHAAPWGNKQVSAEWRHVRTLNRYLSRKRSEPHPDR